MPPERVRDRREGGRKGNLNGNHLRLILGLCVEDIKSFSGLEFY